MATRYASLQPAEPDTNYNEYHNKKEKYEG